MKFPFFSNKMREKEKTPQQEETQAFFCCIPESVTPGQLFRVTAGTQVGFVRCPDGGVPGQALLVTVPAKGRQQSDEWPCRLLCDPPRNKDKQQTEQADVFRVIIPNGVAPGEQFQTMAGTRMVPVTCPPGGQPGQALSITVPKQKTQEADAQLFEVTVPKGVTPGHYFQTMVGAQMVWVRCPPYTYPGQVVSVAVPKQTPQKADTQLFEVTLPPGARPGKPFSLMASGQRLQVTCPENVSRGDRMQFRVPKELLNRLKLEDEMGRLGINREWGRINGWTRKVRLPGMKFQWTRHECIKSFDIHKTAYVLKLELGERNEQGLQTGSLSLVPASDAVADSCIMGSDGKELVSYTDLVTAQDLPFEARVKWFHETCNKFLKVAEPTERMQVQRGHLLAEESMGVIMQMSNKDLRKPLRVCFVGETQCCDEGGNVREWIQLATEELMDNSYGLWELNANQRGMLINPASASCRENHLLYYRFLGRVIGIALMNGYVISTHLAQHIYKHILGWPVTFADLERVDEKCYNDLKQLVDLAKSGEDISLLCLDFTTTQEVLGQKEEVELVEGGADIEVDNENLSEYLEACLKYRLFDSVKEQLSELLLGIFDVIPEPLLAIFNFEDLERLMCGVPEIDIDDWMENTEYSGEFEETGDEHEVIEWFWEVVRELDHQERARLLQFVTGTSKVPMGGFGCLQHNGGISQRFRIHGVQRDKFLYPRGHTHFHRLDLPLYETKDELREKLTLAVSMVATSQALK